MRCHKRHIPVERKPYVKGAHGEIYADRDPFFNQVMLGQMVEELELRPKGKGRRGIRFRGVDRWGRTIAERTAWRSFLNGF